MPRRNFSTRNNSYTRVPPPPRAPISSLPPQGAPKSNLLGNAASVAAGVAVGNVAGNIATNALFGSGESAQSLRREEQTVSTQTSSNELQVQDNLELSWLRCLRENRYYRQQEIPSEEHPVIDCVKKLAVNMLR